MTAIVRCGSCGESTDSSGSFCTSCGRPLPASRDHTLIDFGQPRSIVIGRGEAANYQIDKPTISGQHALLEVMAGGRFQVRDLGSTNGVAINSPLNRIGQSVAEVRPEDKLYLGRTEVSVRDVLVKTNSGSRATQGRVEKASIKMRDTSMILGRDQSADYRIPHPMVSARHARLSREGNQYFIEDLGSTNGTFVRGRRLPPKTKVAIKAGEEIGFGSYTLVLNDLGYLKATGEEITVTAENLAVHIPKDGEMVELLGDVSLSIEPGDMVALMGPSGAGKTTFLTALNGITRPSGGRVLYRNLDLNENFDLFRTVIGYVPQDDIMHPQLTVYKALYYTAKLRLPADYTEEQIDERIRGVLADVGLEDRINEVIGDSVKKTLSGGQRKRVNLAMELLSDPWVLFLDEPTSGLSAMDARMVVELLKNKLAAKNRSVIVTIHQPSLEVYSQFNLLAMISNHPPRPKAPRVPGRLVYFGPAMDAFEFFGSKSSTSGQVQTRGPEEIEEGLKKKPVDEWVRNYNASSFKKTYVGERQKSAHRSAAGVLPSAKKERFRQLRVLCQRLTELKIRDKGQFAISMLMPLIFGVLVALSMRATLDNTDYAKFMEFSRRLGAACFLMVVAAIWFGCNNAIREIVSERAIYRRERLVNLSLFSYFASKYVVLGLVGLLQCLLMLGIVYFSLGMHADFAQLLFTLWVTAVAGTGLGLCISTVASSNEQSVASLPLALLPMIVLGGVLVTVQVMHDNVILGALSDLAPTRWAYEAALVLENDAIGDSAKMANARTPQAMILTMKDQGDRMAAQCKQVAEKAQACQAALTRVKHAVSQAGSLANRAQQGDVDQSQIAKLESTGAGLASDAERAEAAGNQEGLQASQGAAPAQNSASQGFTDVADMSFRASPGKVRNAIPRHTWNQSMVWLGAMAVFWAFATLVMLKKDEWEWWRDLSSRFKR